MPGQGIGAGTQDARHRGHFCPKVRPRLQGAVNAAWKIRATPPGGGGHLERLSPIHVLRGRVTDRHVPYTESAHRNKKRNKTNIPDMIAWLKLGPGQIQQLSNQIGLKEGRGPRCSVQYR